jgi:RimJ/RimL family protein N-acetyltransferase
MPKYPEQFERWLDLRDGSRVFLRPLKLTDESRVRELFYQLSPESIHYRFFRSIKSMPHAKLQELLTIDYESDMAIVVLADRSEDARMLAIAHYFREPKTHLAETAFLVLDAWQNKGIGTALMASLVEFARLNGIAGITADVLAENEGMLRVLHRCGYPAESTLESGVYHLHVPLEAAEVSPEQKSPTSS